MKGREGVQVVWERVLRQAAPRTLPRAALHRRLISPCSLSLGCSSTFTLIICFWLKLVSRGRALQRGLPGLIGARSPCPVPACGTGSSAVLRLAWCLGTPGSCRCCCCRDARFAPSVGRLFPGNTLLLGQCFRRRVEINLVSQSHAFSFLGGVFWFYFFFLLQIVRGRACDML